MQLNAEVNEEPEYMFTDVSPEILRTAAGLIKRRWRNQNDVKEAFIAASVKQNGDELPKEISEEIIDIIPDISADTEWKKSLLLRYIYQSKDYGREKVNKYLTENAGEGLFVIYLNELAEGNYENAKTVRPMMSTEAHMKYTEKSAEILENVTDSYAYLIESYYLSSIYGNGIFSSYISDFESLILSEQKIRHGLMIYIHENPEYLEAIKGTKLHEWITEEQFLADRVYLGYMYSNAITKGNITQIAQSVYDFINYDYMRENYKAVEEFFQKADSRLVKKVKKLFNERVVVVKLKEFLKAVIQVRDIQSTRSEK